MSRLRVVGRRASTSLSQACGHTPSALAVATRLMIAAAGGPAFVQPTNRQFLRPSVIGRMAFGCFAATFDPRRAAFLRPLHFQVPEA